MIISNEVLSLLQSTIKAGLQEHFLASIDAWIVSDEDMRICLIISAKGNMAVECAIDEVGEAGMIKLVNEISGLVWEVENERLYLKDGYIVVSDESENVLANRGGICIYKNVFLEQYYRISNTKEHPCSMFAEMLYVDGKISKECWDPNFYDCEIRFEKKGVCLK